MRGWVDLSSALALGAAAFFAASAVAGDLPKEGAFSIGSLGTGKFQEMPPGNPAMVGIWDETRKSTSEGLLKDMEWRCFGASEVTDGFKTPNGYCVGAAQDGDQVVFRITTEKPSFGSEVERESGVSIAGTGKYKGIVASYKDICQIIGPANAYRARCLGEGTYKLP